MDQIDWGSLQKKDFRRDPENPDKFEQFQAEAHIYRHLPIGALAGIACYGPEEKTRLEIASREANVQISIAVKPDWYF